MQAVDHPSYLPGGLYSGMAASLDALSAGGPIHDILVARWSKSGESEGAHDQLEGTAAGHGSLPQVASAIEALPEAVWSEPARRQQNGILPIRVRDVSPNTHEAGRDVGGRQVALAARVEDLLLVRIDSSGTIKVSTPDGRGLIPAIELQRQLLLWASTLCGVPARRRSLLLSADRNRAGRNIAERQHLWDTADELDWQISFGGEKDSGNPLVRAVNDASAQTAGSTMIDNTMKGVFRGLEDREATVPEASLPLVLRRSAEMGGRKRVALDWVPHAAEVSFALQHLASAFVGGATWMDIHRLAVEQGVPGFDGATESFRPQTAIRRAQGIFLANSWRPSHGNEALQAEYLEQYLRTPTLLASGHLPFGFRVKASIRDLRGLQAETQATIHPPQADGVRLITARPYIGFPDGDEMFWGGPDVWHEFSEQVMRRLRSRPGSGPRTNRARVRIFGRMEPWPGRLSGRDGTWYASAHNSSRLSPVVTLRFKPEREHVEGDDPHVIAWIKLELLCADVSRALREKLTEAFHLAADMEVASTEADGAANEAGAAVRRERLRLEAQYSELSQTFVRAAPASDEAVTALEAMHGITAELKDLRLQEVAAGRSSAPKAVTVQGLGLAAVGELLDRYALPPHRGIAPQRVERQLAPRFTDWRFTPDVDTAEARWTCNFNWRTTDDEPVVIPLGGRVGAGFPRPDGRRGTSAPGRRRQALREVLVRHRPLNDTGLHSMWDGRTENPKHFLNYALGPALRDYGVANALVRPLIDHPFDITRAVIWEALTGEHSNAAATPERPFVDLVERTYLRGERPDGTVLEWVGAAVPAGPWAAGHSVAAALTLRPDGEALKTELMNSLDVSERELIELRRPSSRHMPSSLLLAPRGGFVALPRCPHDGCAGYADVIVPLPEVVATGQALLCSRCRRSPSPRWGHVRFPAIYVEARVSRLDGLPPIPQLGLGWASRSSAPPRGVEIASGPLGVTATQLAAQYEIKVATARARCVRAEVPTLGTQGREVVFEEFRAHLAMQD